MEELKEALKNPKTGKISGESNLNSESDVWLTVHRNSVWI
jgi:hypothetical protein